MQTTTGKTFEDLVEQTLGSNVPLQMEGSIAMSALSPGTQAFILRALVLMQRAGYSASEFNPALIRWLSITVPGILPGAWGGRIPPLTLPGRHKKLDEYVAIQNRASGDEPPVFLDVGCGFPPVTSADTARRFPDWHIYGVDYSFDDYVLYDSEGHYACFDEKGGFQYFQAMMNPSGRALYADPQATRKRFIGLYEELAPRLQNANANRSETVEEAGNRLIHHHVRDFEKDNLTFIKSDILEVELQPVDVIRCMNVFIYFEPEIRKKMRLQMGALLDDGGIMIAGTNGLGIQSRYAVYQKDADDIILDEFAFGLDNAGHIVFMPFFSIHDNDPEAMLLADLAGAIRADRSFWPEFSNRQDELLKQHGICQRRSDGYLQFSEDEIPPSEYLGKNFLLWQQMEAEGYLEGAINALGQAGYEVWKNPVGDIAVRPSAEVRKEW